MTTSASPPVGPDLPAGRRVCPSCGAVFTARKRGGSPLCRVCIANQTKAYLYFVLEHRDRRRKRDQSGKT